MAKYKKIARFHPNMVYVRSIPDLALNILQDATAEEEGEFDEEEDGGYEQQDED